ncbi:MAG: hypothetical protein CHACPFDD_03943 [Phycisphaerae bacterium]|nr:hypothetical protein [Phycisphaerae bacterium]
MAIVTFEAGCVFPLTSVQSTVPITRMPTDAPTPSSSESSPPPLASPGSVMTGAILACKAACSAVGSRQTNGLLLVVTLRRERSVLRWLACCWVIVPC